MPAQDDKLVTPLQTQAGVKRDGTPFDGNYYADALWCRFRNGRPKKMGGYRDIINLNSSTVPANNPLAPVRAIEIVTSSPQALIHGFHGNGITQVSTDENGVGGSCADRTPGGFVAGDYIWTTDVMWDSVGAQSRIVAHAANCLNDVTSDVASDIYYATGNAVAAFTSLTGSGAPQVSGGICMLQPFVFAFGSNGLIANSDANKPTVWSGGQFNNSANVCSTKVIAGKPLRGGANSPAGLFWSLDSLVRVSFVGGTILWKYDTITDDCSILSSKCVVEYDGIYYWPGIDRFLVYNGVVKELPNPLNADFFYDNLNMAARNKVWGMKIGRWGEIWWFFPNKNAPNPTECNWAVIYNVRENTWYDTPIARSGGIQPREFNLLVWADAIANKDSGSTGYRLYRHEIGKDQVIGATQTAIKSYYETSSFGYASGGAAGQGAENPNVLTRVLRIEPDFAQSGPLQVSLVGTSFPGDTVQQVSNVVSYTPGQTESVVDFRQQMRLPRLHVESNVQGGDYFAGKIQVHMEPGDDRP